MAKKKDKEGLLEAALCHIKKLEKQLEKTDRRKEAARERKGASRYHALVKARAIEQLRQGKILEEVSAACMVGLGALTVWAKGIAPKKPGKKHRARKQGKQ